MVPLKWHYVSHTYKTFAFLTMEECSDHFKTSFEMILQVEIDGIEINKRKKTHIFKWDLHPVTRGATSKADNFLPTVSFLELGS